jgi:thymidine phosphorylase
VPTSAADPSLQVSALLAAKREGRAWSAEQVQRFVDGVLDDSISRPQAAAALAFTLCRGMSEDETVALTRAMARSGQRLAWPAEGGPLCDKHSTGGVGDKVSLVLAPLWAELGARVPMLSGRGLGHTGGTLDKLEAIPGFRTDLSMGALHSVLDEVGCFISGQTAELAPADRVLYALRDETGTVASIPLITASILSKKYAAGIDALVMDVKWGTGAFMPTEAEAQALADALVRTGAGLGIHMRAVLSPMSTPLGRAIGNALEVQEAIAALQGQGDPALVALTCALIGDPRAEAVLASGAAYERFCRMVRAQGGDPAAPLRGLDGVRERVVCAEHSGALRRLDALGLGQAAVLLGAGRQRQGEAVHPGVGLLLLAKEGERVEAGQPLIRVLHADVGLDAALSLIGAAVEIGPA